MQIIKPVFQTLIALKMEPLRLANNNYFAFLSCASPTFNFFLPLFKQWGRCWFRLELPESSFFANAAVNIASLQKRLLNWPQVYRFLLISAQLEPQHNDQSNRHGCPLEIAWCSDLGFALVVSPCNAANLKVSTSRPKKWWTNGLIETNRKAVEIKPTLSN